MANFGWDYPPGCSGPPEDDTFSDYVWCKRCGGDVQAGGCDIGGCPANDQESRPREQYLYPMVKSFHTKPGYEFACYDTYGKELHRDKNLLEVMHALREAGYSFFQYPKDNRLHNLLETIDKLELIAEQRRLDREFDKF